MRRFISRLGVFAVFLTLGAAPQSNQAVTYATLVANQSGNFTWVGSAPSSTTQALTYGAYKTYVQNQTTTCTVPGLSMTYGMTWQDVIACASTHTASQQSESVNGNYHTISYLANFNTGTGLYTCLGTGGTSDGYTGTPIALPAGTIAPSGITPLALSLSSVSFPGSSTSLTVQLKNPSGSVVQTWPGITTTWSSGNYTTAGAAGAWSWVITQTGGTDGTCNPSTGASGGGTQASWSANATWFQ